MIDSQNSPESEKLRVITLMVVRRGVGDKKAQPLMKQLNLSLRKVQGFKPRKQRRKHFK